MEEKSTGRALRLESERYRLGAARYGPVLRLGQLLEEAAVGLELSQRAGIEEDALLHERLQVTRQLLRGDLNLLGGDAGPLEPEGPGGL